MHNPPWCPYITITQTLNHQETSEITSVADTEELVDSLSFCAATLAASKCHGALFFIVHTVWSRIIVMHWKQGSMTGTDRQGDTPYIYSTRYWQSYCHLSHSERGRPALSFDQWYFHHCFPHVLLVFVPYQCTFPFIVSIHTTSRHSSICAIYYGNHSGQKVGYITLFLDFKWFKPFIIKQTFHSDISHVWYQYTEHRVW